MPPFLRSYHMLEYKRVELATEPVYGKEYIIGNLVETKNLVEKFLLETKSGPIRKEILPFLCVVNPPRHGKSLLLDSIFAGNDNILVISISYNTGPSFDSNIEIRSVESAIHFFWLRVMKALLNSFSSLKEMNKNFEAGILLSSFDDVVKKVSDKFKVNPFIFDFNDKKKGVLICVDEFSLITDAIKVAWTNQQQKDFLNSIHKEIIPNHEKILNHPFRQFLFTGFNRDMTNLLSNSSAVKTFTLKMCDYISSRPLLGKIVESYADVGRAVPGIIFESVKCTPGLIGQWAEFIVNDKSFPSNIVDFRSNVSWLYNISSGLPLQENWKLLVAYLTACETDPNNTTHTLESMTDRLITAGIGTQSNGAGEIIPHFVPICMVLIILYTDRNALNTKEQLLLNMMISLVDVLQQADIIKKDGKNFESFVQRALMLRLALRSDYLTVFMNLSSLIPGSIYKGTVEETSPSCEKVITREYFFHGISSKEELKQFLLSPIYNLFPVGWATLNSKKCSSVTPITSLQNWIQQNTSLELLPPLDMYCELKNSVLMNQDKTKRDLPQPVSLVPMADNGVLCAFQQQFYCWLSQFPGPIDTSKRGQIDLINTYLNSSNLMNQETKDELLKWWRGIVERNLPIARCFENNMEASFICTPENARGHDLTFLWKELKATGFVDEYECQEIDDSLKEGEGEEDRVIVHIAAIEIKDRRFTPPTDW
eukprot:CAMPEP_0170057106 /NCGR_PEP_ID=MMETSP0019_2-20121128/243_1 /TAXON_ID=98059 /ORGANISM="Dinobryon sp., Strain UTEXLB2267" /LENGTH=709 /DNA_ID=CAMNT_0010261743 /DNA_START=982 /DNA_END=3108 /DNA_ORIENTATION=-